MNNFNRKGQGSNKMKKYIFYLASFMILYFIFQLGSGLLLTMFYTPDFTAAYYPSTNNIQEVNFGNVLPLQFVFILIIASISFILTERVFKLKSRV